MELTMFDSIIEAITQYWAQLPDIVKSIVAIIVTVFSYYFVRYIIVRRIERLTASTENDLDDRFTQFLKQFLWLAAFVIGLIWVLTVNGIAIGPVLAGAGIFGIAIGLAAKETLADILSGIFLIADRPVRIGDRVLIDRIGKHWGAWGDVVDIGLRRTTVRNTDGVIVNYPNSVLANNIIKNFSFEPQPVRARIRFQVDYSADIDLVKKTSIEAVARVKGIIPQTATVVLRSMWDDDQGHQHSGVLYELRYQLEEVRRRTPIRSEVLEHLIRDFQANKIPLASQPVNLISDDSRMI